MSLYDNNIVPGATVIIARKYGVFRPTYFKSLTVQVCPDYDYSCKCVNL